MGLFYFGFLSKINVFEVDGNITENIDFFIQF